MARVAARLLTAGALSWSTTICGACSSGRLDPVSSVVPARFCQPTAGPSTPRLTVVLPQRALAARAPLPANDAEAIIFPHLYETLARLDCAGDPIPALAKTWHASRDQRTWTIELRPGQTYWDGSPVNAESVRRSWQWQSQRQPPTDPPWCWIDPDSVSVTAKEELRIALAAPRSDLPLLLTHPALAATRPPRGRHRPPLGSGPVQPGEWLPTRLDLTARPGADSAPPWQMLRFHFMPHAAMEELLALGADILLLREQEQIAALRRTPGYEAIELPKDHFYAWLPGPGATAKGSPIGSGLWIHERMRTALADQLLGAPADTAASAAFTFSPGSFGDTQRFIPENRKAPAPGGIAPRHRRGVAFDWTDPVAHEIAQLLAAQATAHAPPGHPWALHPMPPHEFHLALHRGSEVAQILRLDRAPGGLPLQRQALRQALPWVVNAGAPPAIPLVPLIATHAVLFQRRDVVGLRLRADGTPCFDRIGRSLPG
jgi:hypothetical protein